MRPLRDRLAEGLRRARIGSAHPLYQDLSDDAQEDYRRSADILIAIGRTELDYAIEDERERP